MKKLPKYYTDIVGTKKEFGGGLFSSQKDLPFEEYDILNWRWGRAKICDMKTLEMKYPTIEYLIKKDGMRASRWTRPFPVREIILEKEKNESNNL
jgi:hypothetical protein